ncbi:MAG: DUF2934 domain-containing protein [Gammaproteobacteria bacterium]|nr:DUF2934 domain-containing protein [Gammaproteobacteria bacterium]
MRHLPIAPGGPVRRKSSRFEEVPMHSQPTSTAAAADASAAPGRDHPDRHAMIREAAYRLAEARNFAPGRELEDWLAAEAEVDQRLYGEGRLF